MNQLEILQFLIYAVFMFSIVAYATLDGFDLGVGILHLLAKNDTERRLMINSIGPVWDGNTTWIVIGAGVLFAGFPKVFATLMGGFYTPVMALLFAFMLRGAAIEFRSKRPGKGWRTIWDIAFSFASLLLAILVGLMLGNLVQGLPLGAQGKIEGGLAQLVTPFPFLVSLFGLSIFAMHGSIFLLMKTEGALHNRIRKWVYRFIGIFLLMWLITTLATFHYHEHMLQPFFKHPGLFVFALLSIIWIIAIPFAVRRQKDGWAFLFSCFAIIFLLLLFVIGTYPYLVYSTIDPMQNSMTLFNASSSKLTLIVLTIIAATGAPLSFFYFSFIYRIFRGKIKLDSTSY